MDILQTILTILSGAVGVKVLDVVQAGWRDRKRAKRKGEGIVDALQRARLLLREHAFHARGVAINHGGEDDLDPFPEDPYSEFLEQTQLKE